MMSRPHASCHGSPILPQTTLTAGCDADGKSRAMRRVDCRSLATGMPFPAGPDPSVTASTALSRALARPGARKSARITQVLPLSACCAHPHQPSPPPNMVGMPLPAAVPLCFAAALRASSLRAVPCCAAYPVVVQAVSWLQCTHRRPAPVVRGCALRGTQGIDVIAVVAAATRSPLPLLPSFPRLRPAPRPRARPLRRRAPTTRWVPCA